MSLTYLVSGKIQNGRWTLGWIYSIKGVRLAKILVYVGRTTHNDQQDLPL